MTVNDAITKLKVMLGATEETVVELKFAEAELVDGTQVYAEGEIEPGAILFVRAGEGADPKIHLRPAGVHETTTGLLVTVGENGEIASVEEKGGEELTPAEEQETFEDEEKEDKVEMDADNMLVAIADLIKGYMEEVSEVKEELSSLTERFNEVADEPAAKKVSNTFSENAAKSKNLAEDRLERLVQIRNKK